MGEAADPEVYTAAVAAIMAEYPEDIVRVVTDPRSGIPSRSKWLPTVFEVRQECDRIAAERAAAGQAEERRERQLADRQGAEARRVPHDAWAGLASECEAAAPTKRRLSLEELAADYAARPCALSEEGRERWNQLTS